MEGAKLCYGWHQNYFQFILYVFKRVNCHTKSFTREKKTYENSMYFSVQNCLNYKGEIETDLCNKHKKVQMTSIVTVHSPAVLFCIKKELMENHFLLFSSRDDSPGKTEFFRDWQARAFFVTSRD